MLLDDALKSGGKIKYILKLISLYLFWNKDKIEMINIAYSKIKPSLI